MVDGDARGPAAGAEAPSGSTGLDKDIREVCRWDGTGFWYSIEARVVKLR